MSRTAYTACDLDDIIECEGLDYAIKHYVDSDHIIDLELRTLWEMARKSLVAVENYITKNCERTDDEYADEE